VVQPGEAPGTFADALRRLSGDATYLYVDGSQYWYSLRANITRLATDRAASNVTDENADDEIKRRLQSNRSAGPFAAVHAFPDGPGDVTDEDDGVHLVVLPTDAHHVPKADESPAIAMAEEILTQRNAGPRLNRNLLVFCAASEARLSELRTAARQHLAWKSILEDHQRDKLELTKGDLAQANSKIAETDETVTQRIAETYVHVLVPEQTAGTREIRWHQTKPTGAGSLAERIARKLVSEERLITSYGGTRVRMDLDRVPLWSERGDIGVVALWNAYCQFPYLPRLASFAVLADAVSNGVSKLDWQNETFAYAEGWDETRWVGLVAGQHVDLVSGCFLVRPDVAVAQLDLDAAASGRADGSGASGSSGDGVDGDDRGSGAEGSADGASGSGVSIASPGALALPTRFYAQFGLDPVRAIRHLDDIVRNVVEHLARADGAEVELTLEINAKSPGFDDRTRRVVNENATQLDAKSQEFE
jgi:hypothetical protein